MLTKGTRVPFRGNGERVLARTAERDLDLTMRNIRRIVRFLGLTFSGALLLLVVAMLFFFTQTALRESKTYSESAPRTGMHVKVGGLDVYVQDVGPKDRLAVLFIPATAAWGGTWRGNVEAVVSAGYRAITIDLPPFGFSEKPNENSYGKVDQTKRIISVLDALDIDEVTLVGHSIAGRTTLETAFRDEARVRGLVLVSASSGISPTNTESEVTTSPGLAQRMFGLRPLRNAVMAIVTSQYLSKYFLAGIMLDPEDATDELVRAFQAPFVVKGSSAKMGDWLYTLLTSPDDGISSNAERYQKLTMPTLLVWGKQDTIIPLAEGERLSELIPHAQFVVMDDVNHAPHLEETEEFNRILIQYLRESR